MLKGVNLAKEIVVAVGNKIGVLADMSKILADHGINIIAIAGYAMDKEAKIMLVTDDNLRVMDALKDKKYISVKENEVIVVILEDKPGALKNISAKLAAQDIDIKYIYGTTCPEGCPARLIISTSDNAKAVAAFKKK